MIKTAVGSFDDGSSGALTDQSVGETVAEYYAEAVRRGAALVTIRADESRVDEAAQMQVPVPAAARTS